MESPASILDHSGAHWHKNTLMRNTQLCAHKKTHTKYCRFFWGVAFSSSFWYLTHARTHTYFRKTLQKSERIGEDLTTHGTRVLAEPRCFYRSRETILYHLAPLDVFMWLVIMVSYLKQTEPPNSDFNSLFRPTCASRLWRPMRFTQL